MALADRAQGPGVSPSSGKTVNKMVKVTGAPMTADVTAVVAYLDSHYGKVTPAAP